jgi:ribosomal protein S18 acetylase RimI-like enzyme
VRKENLAARSLYSSLGLVPVGIRPRYYGDDDALILWAHDIDQPEYQEILA